MKFIEKEMTLKQRESLSLTLWLFILCLGGVAFTLMLQDMCLITVPVVIVLLIILRLELKNNKYMGIIIKRKKKEK